MVFRDMASDNLDIVCVTNFSDEVTDSHPDFPGEDWFLVFGRPDQVVL